MTDSRPAAVAVAALAFAGVAAGVASWGLFEAQWVRLVRLELPVPGLLAELDGLTVAHLSDLHAGAPGLNGRALRRGVELAAAARPDLVCITGDLRARRRGDRELRAALRQLSAPLGVFAVLGNHDYGDGHDPFADGHALTDLDDAGVRLLRDETVDLVHHARSIRLAGLDPTTFHRDPDGAAAMLAAPAADLNLLLCHFPDVLDRPDAGAFDLILAGHLHGGQICIPWPTGKLRLAHGPAPYLEGAYTRGTTTMHLSRGLGTTFVPFRFAARPEVTILTLRSGERDERA